MKEPQNLISAFQQSKLLSASIKFNVPGIVWLRYNEKKKRINKYPKREYSPGDWSEIKPSPLLRAYFNNGILLGTSIIFRFNFTRFVDIDQNKFCKIKEEELRYRGEEKLDRKEEKRKEEMRCRISSISSVTICKLVVRLRSEGGKRENEKDTGREALKTNSSNNGGTKNCSLFARLIKVNNK